MEESYEKITSCRGSGCSCHDGSCVRSGQGKNSAVRRYYEDKAGKKLTPIEWTVLDEKDGRTLLITTKVIDAQPFHNKRIAVTWDNCDLL